MADKHVVFGGVSVICGACGSCEAEALDACAADSIVGYTELDCMGDMTMAFFDCSPIAVVSLEYDPPPPACTPTSAMIGELQPITYCC
jgi:hypothetical protein